MKKKGFRLILVLFFFFNNGFGQDFRQIKTGPGPEDMVLDTLQNEDRLIISCSARRSKEAYFGEIQTYSFKNHLLENMIREMEPEGMEFNPHGIYMQMHGDKKVLYVVNHEDEIKRQSIIVYQVKNNRLLFMKQICDPLIVSPNAVAAFPEGGILVSNDSGKRGSVLDKIFGLKTGSLVYISPTGDARILIDHLGMANGIEIDGDQVYLATTLGKTCYTFDWIGEEMKNMRALARFKGQDNIRIYKEYLLIPSHPKNLAFMRHMKSPDKLSPVEIYQVNKTTGECGVLFSDEGDMISAASTAIIVHGKLYLCQVFDPFILEVSLKQKPS